MCCWLVVSVFSLLCFYDSGRYSGCYVICSTGNSVCVDVEFMYGGDEYGDDCFGEIG